MLLCDVASASDSAQKPVGRYLRIPRTRRPRFSQRLHSERVCRLLLVECCVVVREGVLHHAACVVVIRITECFYIVNSMSLLLVPVTSGPTSN